MPNKVKGGILCVQVHNLRSTKLKANSCCMQAVAMVTVVSIGYCILVRMVVVRQSYSTDISNKYSSLHKVLVCIYNLINKHKVSLWDST